MPNGLQSCMQRWKCYHRFKNVYDLSFTQNKDVTKRYDGYGYYHHYGYALR